VSEEQTPDILVNISNLGWFGDNYVVDQHQNIARMRSLEFNRPTVRATNSGGTAIINAQGVIEHRLTPYTRGTLTGEVQSHAQGITPFAYWAGHWGLWPLWFGCMALWGWAFLQYKKNFGDGNAKRAH
jgi:apolipoprotein N-acyltransferase